MGYEYSDPAREADPNALPNVEVWSCETIECDDCGAVFAADHGVKLDRVECGECGAVGFSSRGVAWWYAFGSPGCLRDSEPCGPYDTREQALDAAREE